MKNYTKISNKIALKFRKAWDKNNYKFSDGKSIELWIQKNVEDELKNTKDEWYSVKNPPPVGSYVLVHALGGRRMASIYKGKGNFYCYDINSEEIEIIEEPLDWMYLPDVPVK